MASRYTYSKKLTTNETKKQYLESTIYPKIKPTDNDIYIISTQGDRLDLLSNKYYGDKNLWWVISVANNLNDASLHIEVGKQLRIPGNISTIIFDLEKINK
jgi:nucleoid-associated protein YgaU